MSSPTHLARVCQNISGQPSPQWAQGGTLWGADDNRAALFGWCKTQWFSLPLSHKGKGKGWRCSRCWLCLPVSPAGTSEKGKTGTKCGCLGSTAGFWNHSRNWNVLSMDSVWWKVQANDKDSHNPCPVCSRRIPFPYQTKTIGIDGAIKRRVRALRGSAFQEFLKVPQIQQTKSCFLFHRSGKKGKSVCNVNKELKIPQQFLKISSLLQRLLWRDQNSPSTLRELPEKTVSNLKMRVFWV